MPVNTELPDDEFRRTVAERLAEHLAEARQHLSMTDCLSYGRSELSADEMDRIDAHAEDCVECFDRLEAVVETLDPWFGEILATEDDLASILERLDHAEWQQRLGALAILKALGPVLAFDDALEARLKNLTETRDSREERAVTFAAVGALQALDPLLGDRYGLVTLPVSPEAPEAPHGVLAYRANTARLKDLAQGLLSDEPDRREAALSAIGSLGAAAAQHDFLQDLSDALRAGASPDAETDVAEDVADGLWRVGAAAAYESVFSALGQALTRTLSDEDAETDWLRVRSLRALETVGSVTLPADLKATVVAALTDPWDEVRAVALTTAAATGILEGHLAEKPEERGKVMLGLVRDASASVRQTAVRLLNGLLRDPSPDLRPLKNVLHEGFETFLPIGRFTYTPAFGGAGSAPETGDPDLPVTYTATLDDKTKQIILDFRSNETAYEHAVIRIGVVAEQPSENFFDPVLRLTTLTRNARGELTARVRVSNQEIMKASSGRQAVKTRFDIGIYKL